VAWTWYVIIGAVVTFAVGFAGQRGLPQPRAQRSNRNPSSSCLSS
jgi:hypothetical protein